MAKGYADLRIRPYDYFMYYDEEPLDPTKLKYALYARKSTDDPQRQVRSIQDQIDECLQLAAR